MTEGRFVAVVDRGLLYPMVRAGIHIGGRDLLEEMRVRGDELRLSENDDGEGISLHRVYYKGKYTGVDVWVKRKDILEFW